jgi:hypothetical protein
MSTVGRIRIGEFQISSEVLSVFLLKRKNSDWDPESFEVYEIMKFLIRITELAYENGTKRERKKIRVSADLGGKDVVDDKLAVGGEEIASLMQLLNLLMIVYVIVVVSDENMLLHTTVATIKYLPLSVTYLGTVRNSLSFFPTSLYLCILSSKSPQSNPVKFTVLRNAKKTLLLT